MPEDTSSDSTARQRDKSASPPVAPPTSGYARVRPGAEHSIPGLPLGWWPIEEHPPQGHSADPGEVWLNVSGNPQSIRAAILEFRTTKPLSDWIRVDRALDAMQQQFIFARNEEDFQQVGLLGREVLISLAQVVYVADRHKSLNGRTLSPTDADEMLAAYIAVEFGGSSESQKALRKHAKGGLDLALALQHKRTAQRDDAALCVEAVRSVVNTVAIVSQRPDAKHLARHTYRSEVFSREIPLEVCWWLGQFMEILLQRREELERVPETGHERRGHFELNAVDILIDYSEAEYQRFLPLFTTAIPIVIEKFDRILTLYAEVMPPEFKTMIAKARWTLTVQATTYDWIPLGAQQGKDVREPFRDILRKTIVTFGELCQEAERIGYDWRPPAES